MLFFATLSPSVCFCQRLPHVICLCMQTCLVCTHLCALAVRRASVPFLKCFKKKKYLVFMFPQTSRWGENKRSLTLPMIAFLPAQRKAVIHTFQPDIVYVRVMCVYLSEDTLTLSFVWALTQIFTYPVKKS